MAINPYQRLLDKIVSFCGSLKNRHSKIMFTYPKDQLNTNWSIPQLYEKVATADQLDYDVKLKATTEGLEVWYEKRIEIPIEWKYL